MNQLLKLLLFVFLFFLVGCTITKRRYTGGYYLNWHNKTPDTKLIAQTGKSEPSSIKIVHSNRTTEKTVFIRKTEKHITQKLVHSISSKPNERLLTKSFWNTLMPMPVFSSYTVTPENVIIGHNQSEKDTSKRDARLAWLLCVIGILSVLLLVLFYLGPPFPVMNPINVGPLIGLLLLGTLVLFIISIVHSAKAMKFGHDSGWFIILDVILILLVLIFIIFLFSI